MLGLSSVKEMVLGAASLALLVALLAFGLYHKGVVTAFEFQVDDLNDTITELRADYGTLETENAKLSADLVAVQAINVKLAADVGLQNSAIEKAKAEAERKAKESEAALAKAKEDTKFWQAKANSVVNAPPSDPSDACKSLDNKLNQYLELRLKEIKNGKR